MPQPLPPGADRGRFSASQSPDDPRTQTQPYRYDLYAVTNHYGNLSSGHCKHCLCTSYSLAEYVSRYRLYRFTWRLVVL
jgi:ubiquitin C-terminal hydrolase